jgi:hypothetical protein
MLSRIGRGLLPACLPSRNTAAAAGVGFPREAGAGVPHAAPAPARTAHRRDGVSSTGFNAQHGPILQAWPTSIGTSLVIGTYDAVLGSGSTGGGYYTVTFADGSELWLTYTGGNKIIAGKAVAKGTATVIGGKGRYAGAKVKALTREKEPEAHSISSGTLTT